MSRPNADHLLTALSLHWEFFSAHSVITITAAAPLGTATVGKNTSKTKPELIVIVIVIV
jgi:hypothetical protein